MKAESLKLSLMMHTQISGATGADRISDLPEILVSDILSRLPTVEAVRTCVLSKTWKYNWTSIRSVRIFELNDPHCRSRNRIATIFSLPLINNVTSFTLKCSGDYPNQILSWISAVLGRGRGAKANNYLQEFVLCYLNYGSHKPIYLPHELLDCPSLRKLYLTRQFIIRVPPAAAGVINLPSLTSLYLRDIRILNTKETSSNIDTLVLNLPALKELVVDSCYWRLFKYVEIHAPALSRFDYRGHWEGRRKCSIKITGARLALLNIIDDLVDNIVLDGSTVDWACLQLSFMFTTKLVEEISPHVKHLILSNQVAETIVQKRFGPKFGALERLEIYAISINFGSTLELLDAVPKLRYLTLEARYKDEYDFDAVEHVPSCVKSLEEVRFKYVDYSEFEHLFHMESFFLRNATNLKKVSVLIYTFFKGKEEIIHQISTLMNASATPTITKEGSYLVYTFKR